MQKIYKYPIEPNSSKDTPYKCYFLAPAQSWPLSVGVQNGKCVLWAEVDTRCRHEEQFVYCVGTGHGAVPGPGAEFIGTIQLDGFTWHFYRDTQA